MALDFNTEPYFDDYNKDKDFYRILFRPSYAVQARELTQLQTILQSQVSRFGDHVFKNGSQVIPGTINIDNSVHFIKLEQFTGTLDVTTYIETLKNKVVTGETSGVKMLVVDTSNSGNIDEELDQPTLYCKVVGTADDNETYRLIPGENLMAYAVDNQISSNYRLVEDQLGDIQVIVKATGTGGEEPTVYVTSASTEVPDPESSNVLGYAYSVEVQEGIYYIDGTFVRNDNLKLYVGRFTNKPSYRVGFKVVEDYVTPEDDESILDNATGSYNFAAPGSHRYRIKLSLVKLPLTGQDNIKFVELVRVVDGNIQYKVEKSSYAELEKTLARRTKDESGDYEVTKFKLSTREHLNDGSNQGVYPPLVGVAVDGTTYGDTNKFVIVVDPGKAYIDGYEVENTSSNFLTFNKAREIGVEENGHIKRVGLQNVGFDYGNYVKVDNVYKYPDLTSFQKVYLVKKQQAKAAVLRAVVTGVNNTITAVVVEDPGFGYTSAPTIVFAPTSNFDAGVAATATCVLNAQGGIDVVTMTDGGANQGYTTVPLCYTSVTSGADGGLNLGKAPVSSDIVGTARVKAFELQDGDYNETDTKYKLGLFDIQMFAGFSFERDVKSFVGTAGSNNFSCNVVPTLMQIAGSASSATTSDTIQGQGTAFEYSLKAGDIVYINDVKAGTVSSFTQNTITLASTFGISNALVSATAGRIAIATAVINEPAASSLLFPVGSPYVKTLKARNQNNTADTVSSSVISVRRDFGTKVVTTTYKADFRVTDLDETIYDDADLRNYTLINTSTGRITNINEGDITFNTTGSRQIVYFDKVPQGTYRLIGSVIQEEIAAAEKPKVLNTNYSKIYYGKNIAASTVINLDHCDIFKLKSVMMYNGDFDNFDEDAAVDITNRYTLDNGQRDTHYARGKLTLKAGFQPPAGAIQVKYDYFSGDVNSSGNYFSVDSYKNVVSYTEIPSHYITDTNTGRRTEIRLTDVIDFRPYIDGDNASTHSPEQPKFGSDMIAPIAHYVGRIDKVSLDSFGKLNVITGVPSDSPKEPQDPKGGMVLATVEVPPYTHSIKEINVKQRDNRRYTMRDIGKLERRVANLEYYVTLSLLEKDTAQLQIVDETTGLSRFKNGFIVDQFTGHGVGAVKQEDYKCSIDPSTRTLRPMHYTTALDLVEDLLDGTIRTSRAYKKTGDLITLPYTEDAYIFNNHSSLAMDIHALSMGAFNGQINLFPEGDTWKSENRRPDLNVVDDNNYDAIKFMAEQLGVTGTKWNEWQTNWVPSATTVSTTTGEKRWSGGGINVQGYETTVTTEYGYYSRTGINTELSSTVNSQDYGDRVVDVSYVPYMRARPVTVIAQNLKNTTRFFPFFDSVAVSEYFQPANKFTVTRDSQNLISFDLNDLNDNLLADSDRRAFNGKIESAFALGDELTNNTHSPVNITQIDNLTAEAASFAVYVESTQNIRVGHHVQLFNLDFNNASGSLSLDDLKENQVNGAGVKIIQATNGLLSNLASSKELNLRKFVVTGISGLKLTLANIDGSMVQAFSSYSTGSYDTNKFGRLYRLKASGIVAFGGMISSSDSIGPITQEIYLVNVKNGFSVGESLVGAVNIGNTSTYNGVTVNAINGNTSSGIASTYKKVGDSLITDENGTCVGVFHLPETDTLSFRTGERTLKLTDNRANSDASFDSIGSAIYYSQGMVIDKERTIVSSRSAKFTQNNTYQDTRSQGLTAKRVSTSTRVLYQYRYDPLAQTFTVSSEGGAFVTGLDIYIAAKGTRPVTVELRNTDNGVPSTKVLPFSEVTKTADELNVSEDGSVATSFKFKSPVYLQDAETYAFVVKTDEPGTQIYVSEMGSTDILTGNTIAGQPLTGSLYASQNALEWEIHPLRDIKFVLKKAKFNISSSADLQLKTTPPGIMSLDVDPFEITPGTNLVRVYARDHGLLAGQSVSISGVSEGWYGTDLADAGIPASCFNTTHTVLASGLDKDSFVINLVTSTTGDGVTGPQNLLTYKNQDQEIIEGTNADFVKGEYGGIGVRCSRGLNYDILFLKTSDIVLPETSIDYSVQGQTANGDFTEFLPFVSNANFSFPERMNVRGFDNQDVDINGNKQSSLLINANLYSSNANISPVVDLQQLSAYTVCNRISDYSAATVNVDAIDTRILLAGSDFGSAFVLNTNNYSMSGDGTITVTNGSSAVTGTSSLFSTQVVAGNILKTPDGNVLGAVLSVTDNNTLTLTGNAETSYTGAYVVYSVPTLAFVNEEGVGVIKTNIDVADNLLATAGIGKTLVISGVAEGVDGEYVVSDVRTIDDVGTYAGNSELDITKVFLDRAFTATSTFDMTTDNDFKVEVKDKYVADIAPVGCSNEANYITRNLSLTEPADRLKIMFDSNMVNNTSVSVYYRTWTGDVNLDATPWKDTGYVSSALDPEGKFVERTIDVSDIEPFYNVSVKIVMKSTNPVYVPKVQNLRILALS